MGDDLEFIIKFVRLIEQYKALYDHSNEGNSNRLVQEKAWREIASELGENWMSCKEKWKNIRSCYTRHLRQKAGDKAKKPYYLSKHLEFLLPYCRSMAPLTTTPPFSSPSQAVLWSKIEATEEEPEEDPLTFDNNKEEDVTADHLYFTDPPEADKISNNHEQTKTDKETTVFNNPSALRKWKRRRKLGFSSERRLGQSAAKRSNNTDLEDSDLHFFKSLLPEVQRMSSKQKNRLKITILSEINRILYPDELDCA